MTKMMTNTDMNNVKQMILTHKRFKLVNDEDAGTAVAYVRRDGEKDVEILRAIRKDKNTWIATLTDCKPEIVWVS